MSIGLIALCLIAYLLGAMPYGKWIASHYGVDILETGSRNIGATNVWRAIGPKAGVTVFVLDALKGYAPALAGGYERVLLGNGLQFQPTKALLVGGCAVLGHSLSVFGGFRGGKSVAAALGVVLAISPGVAVLSLAAFFVVFGVTRYVSLGSIVGVGAAPALAAVFRYPLAVCVAYAIMSSLIIYRHKANIVRLLNGEEYRFGGDKKADDTSTDEAERQEDEGDASITEEHKEEGNQP